MYQGINFPRYVCYVSLSYEIENVFSAWSLVRKPVFVSYSERVSSHVGKKEITLCWEVHINMYIKEYILLDVKLPIEWINTF